MEELPEYIALMTGSTCLATTWLNSCYRHGLEAGLYLRSTALSDVQWTAAWFLTDNHFPDWLGSIYDLVSSYGTQLRCLLALIVQGGLRGEELMCHFQTAIESHRTVLKKLTDEQASAFLGDQIGLDVWGIGETSPFEFFEGHITLEHTLSEKEIGL